MRLSVLKLLIWVTLAAVVYGYAGERGLVIAMVTAAFLVITVASYDEGLRSAGVRSKQLYWLLFNPPRAESRQEREKKRLW